MPDPYIKFKKTKLWKTIDSALNDLEANHDIQITTMKPYVIGYICKKISNLDRSYDQTLPGKPKL